jgi:hypothetical protein
MAKNKSNTSTSTAAPKSAEPAPVAQTAPAAVPTMDVAALAGGFTIQQLQAMLAQMQQAEAEKRAAEMAAVKAEIDARHGPAIDKLTAELKALTDARDAEYTAKGVNVEQPKPSKGTNGHGKGNGTRRGEGVKDLIRARLAETGGQTTDQLADYMWEHAHYAEKRTAAAAEDKAAGITNPNMGATGKLAQTVYSTVNWNLGRQEKDGVARGLDLKPDDKGVYRIAETAAVAG